MAIYKDKGFPAFPGAYIINGLAGSFPIYKSTPDLGATGSIGASNTNDYLLVMPGYKIVIYTDANYATNERTIDNTAYSSIYHVKTITPIANQITSIKLFYGSTEIN
jgi:hypothetical protein